MTAGVAVELRAWELPQSPFWRGASANKWPMQKELFLDADTIRSSPEFHSFLDLCIGRFVLPDGTISVVFSFHSILNTRFDKASPVRAVTGLRFSTLTGGTEASDLGDTNEATTFMKPPPLANTIATTTVCCLELLDALVQRFFETMPTMFVQALCMRPTFGQRMSRI